jgi:hypothetical protein
MIPGHGGGWWLRGLVILGLAVGLVVMFPHAFAFAEAAALSAMRLWWLVLLVALALWLIWGMGRGG